MLSLNGCASQRTSTSTGTLSGSVPPAPATLPAGYARSYVVFGKRYYVLQSASGFSEQGIASWYGPKFHGRKTANGETYNMHGMSAAHKNLPLGSWVRVTNLNNQRNLDVRINDRGPFVENRVIDLSYAAAKALDVVGPGTAPVRVVALEGTQDYSAGTASSDSTGSGGGSVVTATIDRPAVIDSRPAPTQLPPVVVAAPKPGPVTTGPAVVGKTITPTTLQSDSSNFKADSFIQVASFGAQANAQRMVTQLEQSGFSNVIIQALTINNRLLHRVRLGPLLSASQQQELLIKLSNMGLLGARVVSE